ncbi:MAG TPA: fasciclin domain-containing protein [Miltoncostaeaceae bacterium]|nr:fasciclin domain-containing protein [Miltoncostaeaceae bacterium]
MQRKVIRTKDANVKRIITTVAATALLAAPAAALGHGSQAAERPDIVELAASNPQFSTLVSLVKKAGLVSALSAPGPVTVFAPTNAAFAKVPKATLDALAADKKLLRSVLTYHVVKGAVPASKVVTLNGKKVTTLNGAKVTIRITGKTKKSVYVNNAKVLKVDLRASNGIVHSINRVLIPPSS